MLLSVSFVVVCFDSHLRVTALGARCRSRKNTLLDRPPHGFMCALLLGCLPVSGSPSVSVDAFLFKVVPTLGGTLTVSALRLQSVWLASVSVEVALRQLLLAARAEFHTGLLLHTNTLVLYIDGRSPHHTGGSYL
jgi:hypothetical protein